MRKRDPTLDAHVEPMTVVPAMGFAAADHAMTYAKALFKRLTGYAAAHTHNHAHGMAGTEADHAMAYAEDTFARMKGYRPGLENGDAGVDCVARRRRVVGREVGHAMAYAKDVFKRLRGLPARGPLGRNVAQSGRTEAAFVNTVFPIANAIGRAIARLTRWVRTSVLEPYVRGRQRRIAIAELEALDDRLLADIGLTRNDVEPMVDGMLARRGDTVSRPVNRPLLAAERPNELPLAA